MKKDIPAFPYTDYNGMSHEGMTLRDYFADGASEEDVKEYRGELVLVDSMYQKYEFEYTREQAKYRYADAMLAAREETK